MNPTIQHGMHPDADTLTAFAEQLLPQKEREQVLAHAAVCSRCREVIFLARQAAGDEPVTAASLTSARQAKPRAWFAGWRLAWVPAGVLAAVIGVAMVLHFRRAETGTQVARINPAGESAQQSPVQQASPATGNPRPEPPEPSVPQKTKPRSVRDRMPDQESEEVLDQKGSTRQKEFALGKAAPPARPLPPGVAGGSIHGALTARAQSTPFDGPMANQSQNAMQQQNAIQQNTRVPQNQLQPRQPLDQKPADDQKAPSQAPVSATSETVAVERESEKVTPATPLPSAPPQISDELMKARSFEIAPAATAQLKKASKVALPGGSQPLSVAFAADRTIAIDTSGALFLSEDQGKHWQPVATQWTGRAVLVRNLQAGKDMAGVLQSVRKMPAVRFQLVNDKLQTWNSPDGKIWTAVPTPNK